MKPLFASLDRGGTNVTAALAGAEGRAVVEDKQPGRTKARLMGGIARARRGGITPT